MIWQIIIDFLKLLSDFDEKPLLNALLSYFLLLIIIATGTKTSAIESCQTWMSLTLSDTKCPA